MVDSMKDIIENEVRELNNMFEFNRCFYDSLSDTLNDPDITEKFTAVKAHAEAYTNLMIKVKVPDRIRFDVHFSTKKESFVCVYCTAA